MILNKISLSFVLAAVIAFGNQLVPIVPPVWGALISAVIGVIGLYHTGKVVTAARSMGIKGV